MLRICGGDTHRPRIRVQGWWMQEHLAQVYRNRLIRFTCGGTETSQRPRICAQGWWMQEHLAQVYRNGLIRFTCGGKYGKAK